MSVPGNILILDGIAMSTETTRCKTKLDKTQKLVDECTREMVVKTETKEWDAECLFGLVYVGLCSLT